MAHWAEIDSNNIVIRVLVGDNNDPAGDEGYQWLIDNLGGTWVKTSYNAVGGKRRNPETNEIIICPSCNKEQEKITKAHARMQNSSAYNGIVISNINSEQASTKIMLSLYKHYDYKKQKFSNQINDLKTNGLENIFDVAKRVSSQLSGLIDPSKMAKTANKMTDLMANNSDKLKDLKDDNGNPIGEQLFNQFKATMDMANKMNKK